MNHHHHKKPHRVKIHKWNFNGVLEIIEHAFEDLETALSFAETQKFDPIRAVHPVVKVVEEETDQVVHQTGHDSATYA